jgi:hypothetical protein
VLEPEDEFAQQHRIWLELMPVRPGDTSRHPLIVYNVIVCGDKPFQGAILLGGSARLTDAQVLVPRLTSSGVVPDWQAAETRMGGGSFLPVDSPFAVRVEAQVIRFTVTPIQKCLPAEQIGDLASGTPFTLRGRLAAPIAWQSHYGPWKGPRYRQAWPSVGWLPGVATNFLGEFRDPPGLEGSWSRPRNIVYTVQAGTLGPRLDVELARPETESAEALTWRSPRPITPIAKYLDADALAAWQQRLVLVGILFGIGASVTATLIVDGLRRWQNLRPSVENPVSSSSGADSEELAPPHHNPIVGCLALVIAVGTVTILRSRRRRRTQAGRFSGVDGQGRSRR